MSDPTWGTGGGGAPPRADWYPDPSGGAGQRYWDGTQWTGHVRAPAPAFAGVPIQRSVSAKSPILAIVLSILWLGAGHFYAGRTDTLPIVFAVVNGFLWVLTFMCLIGIIPWIPMVIFACIDARRSAIDFNNRHGLATPA
jgi:TM2 domain-containing membrane protein YozV